MNNRDYYKKLVQIRDEVPKEKLSAFDEYFFLKRKNQTQLFVYSLFLGWLGVDRFALGQVGLGILKLLTLGGLFIWSVIDLFLVAGTARGKNIEMANSCLASLSEACTND